MPTSHEERPIDFRYSPGIAALFLGAFMACSGQSTNPSPDQGDDGDTPAASSRSVSGRFELSLLLLDAEIPELSPLSECLVPVRGPANDRSSPPEVGLKITSERAEGRTTAETDEAGITALAGLASGAHSLVLEPTAGPTVRINTLLEERRNRVQGSIERDARDFDNDGDLTEWVVHFDILPDANLDGISDSGRRSEWWLGEAGGFGYRHLGNGRTERVTVDGDGIEATGEAFDDRDGDLIPDSEDDDDDGDGVLDQDEVAALACPGFSHDDLFAATSKHRDFQCVDCHREDTPRPYACDDCHSSLGRVGTEVPANVPSAHFLRQCDQCHNAQDPWNTTPGPDGESHSAWPLVGAHLAQNCFTCHNSGNPAPEQACEACHTEQLSPDHFQSGCEACHTAEGWTPANVGHEQFPLTDAHDNLDCAQCHTPPNYADVESTCAGCHLDDAPSKHEQPGFSAQACDQCHAPTKWTNYRFDHSPIWILSERHAEVACASCHTDAAGYAGNDRACVSCHNVPVFPDHSNEQVFGPNCDRCHTEAGWVPAIQGAFDHDLIWPLENAHATALCSTCHENGNRPTPPRNCDGCHLPDRPARHTGFFEGSCDQCHQTTAWADLNPPYSHTPSFPLDGRHSTVACAICHQTSYIADPACVSCHAGDTPPNHYGNTCEACHNSESWNPIGGLNHHVVDPNAFPLTLSHSNLLCSQCHVSGFGPLPRTCESCHLNDRPPGHANSSCDGCHVASSWSQPTQPPANAMHPLAGGHAATYCIYCHGSFQGGAFTTPTPPSDCASCHALPAVHIPVGATACDSCHSVTGWVPATGGGHEGPLTGLSFPYDTWSGQWFPVPHRRASQCNSCHVDLQNRGFPFFSCTDGCHRGIGDKDDHQRSSIFHLDPNEANNPPDQGGAVWPTGHVGCVNRNCHPDGRN